MKFLNIYQENYLRWAVRLYRPKAKVAAINMVYGAGAAGARVMTSSSSPGIALKQEGIGYCVMGEIPCVIVSVMRGGPGLGTIQPSQSDYNQATRGGGNGDYHLPVLAPGSIQEAVDDIKEAFEIAEFYRTPVMVVADGLIGQMMEPVDFDVPVKTRKQADKSTWALGMSPKGKTNTIVNLEIDAHTCEERNLRFFRDKYAVIEKEEVKYNEFMIIKRYLVNGAAGFIGSNLVRGIIENDIFSPHYRNRRYE